MRAAKSRALHLSRCLMFAFCAILALNAGATLAADNLKNAERSGKKSSSGKAGKKPKKSDLSEDSAKAKSLPGESKEGTKDAAKNDSAKGATRKEVLGTLAKSKLLEIGATGGLLKPNGSALEASFSYGKGMVNNISTKIIHLGARYRKSILKLGYVAGGAGLRMASGSWLVLNTTADQEYPASGSLNAITLDGAVGAQARFGSFVAGADILGVSVPLLKLGVKKTPPNAEDYDAADADSQAAKFEKNAGGTTITILRLGVGLLF